MEKKIKTGILLILAALCIGGIFLWQTYRGREKNELPETGAQMENTGYSKELFPETVSQGSVSGTVVSPGQADPPELSVEETGEQNWADINPDILQYMGITEGEFSEKLRIYANECGYGAAEEAGDLKEMIVDYGKKTITIPCYFKVGNTVSKFDVVYQYEKRKYRFVPW